MLREIAKVAFTADVPGRERRLERRFRLAQSWTIPRANERRRERLAA
jgi:hypothetical protein